MPESVLLLLNAESAHILCWSRGEHNGMNRQSKAGGKCNIQPELRMQHTTGYPGNAQLDVQQDLIGIFKISG